jgi:hypothetical protein
MCCGFFFDYDFVFFVFFISPFSKSLYVSKKFCLTPTPLQRRGALEAPPIFSIQQFPHYPISKNAHSPFNRG